MKRTKVRSLLVILLAFCVALGTGLTSFSTEVYAAGKVKVKSVTLNHKVYTIKKGKTVKLNAKVLPKNSSQKTIVWKTSKKKVATVNKGKVKGKKNGKTVITATVKGSKKKAKATIYVGTPVKKAVFKASTDTITVGETKSVAATVTPAKATVKKIVYSSSDPAVATIDASGKVKGIKAGIARIMATPVDEAGKPATMTVTVTEKKTDNTGDNTGGNTGDNTVDNTGDNNGDNTGDNTGGNTGDNTGGNTEEQKGIVATQEDLVKALKEEAHETLTIRTDQEVNIDIPEGEYPDTTLVINAPKGHIENHAKFKDIRIEAVSNTSFVEYAVGNAIHYLAESGTVKVAEGASSNVSVEQGAAHLNLVNNGIVAELKVAVTVDVIITGNSDNTIPTQVTEDAAGSSIDTEQKLDINAKAKVFLTIRAGAELTSATVDNKASIPAVSGIGRIAVTVTVDDVEVYVVAVNDEDVKEVRKVGLEGSVKGIGGDAEGADVYLIPYEGEFTAQDLTAATDKAVMTAKADADGNYSFENVELGNYYVLTAKEGSEPACTTVILTSNSAETVTVGSLSLISIKEDITEGILEGNIVDSATGDPSDKGLTIIVRAGGNNLSGDEVARTETDGNGHYVLPEKLPLGAYTVQVVDRRENAEKHYVTTYFEANITGEKNTADGTVSYTLESDQIRFVLTWGDEASGASSDLDSHLIGPAAEVGQFHTWFGDRTYGTDIEYDDEGDVISVGTKYADLDRDDTDWEGPETTTIYRKSSGTYSFYIHDFSNGTDNASTQMAKSKAVVNVYIGSKLVETYNMPNKAGVLWYVCDYNADKNTVAAVNKIIQWNGEPDDIGLSQEEINRRAAERLEYTISEAEAIVKSMGACDEKSEGESKIAAGKAALNSDDLDTINTARSAIESWMEDLSRVSRPEVRIDYDDESGVIFDYSYDTNDNGDNVLYIYGYESSAPDLNEYLYVTDADEGASIVYTRDASDSEYEGTAVVTSVGGYSLTWKIKYEVSSRSVEIRTVNFGDNEEFSEYWCDDGVKWSDDDYDNLEYRYIKIYGFSEAAPSGIYDALNVVPFFKDAVVTMSASDRSDFDRLITISYDDFKADYYVRYEFDTDYAMSIESVYVDRVDEDGEKWEDTFGHSWDDVYGEDEELLYQVIQIEGNTLEMPDDIKVRTRSDKAKAVIGPSDRDGYEKMITVTLGDVSKVYYVTYALSRYDATSISQIEADPEGTGYDETIYFDYDWDWAGDDDDEYQVMTIRGETETLPENTVVVPYLEGAETVITASDRDDYEKMITVTYNKNGYDYSRNYYIVYEQYDY